MWLFVVIFGHFLNALAFVVDKYLLSKKVPEPALYASTIGLGGLLAFLLYPFGADFLPQKEFFLSLFSGATFVLALLFFFQSLAQADASRVVVFVGAIQPILIFFLAKWFLSEELLTDQIIGFVLLILGGTLMAYHGRGGQLSAPTKAWTSSAFFAAFLFAISFVAVKDVFNESNFLSGLVWSRLGGALMAGVFFLIPSLRRKMIQGFHNTSEKTRSGALVIGSQLAGAGGFLLVTYGISLGSVTLTQSLQGIQYVFLFFLTLFLSWKYPKILQEKISSKILLQKSLAILFIFIGLVFL